MWKKILGKIWRKSPAVIRKNLTRAIQTKFTVSAGVIVFNGEGKVLLLDHVLRPASGWGIPGGFVKGNEAPENAARRELCEEIGLEIENVEMLKVQTFGRHVEILFRARAFGEGAVKSFEINRIGWFALDDLPPEMNRSQKKIINEASSKEISQKPKAEN